MSGHEFRDAYDDWWFDLLFHDGIISIIVWIFIIAMLYFSTFGSDRLEEWFNKRSDKTNLNKK